MPWVDYALSFVGGAMFMYLVSPLRVLFQSNDAGAPSIAGGPGGRERRGQLEDSTRGSEHFSKRKRH